MLVNGLLLTLHEDDELRSAVIQAIAAQHSNFTTGPLHDRWLPVVMEAATDVESRQLHDWLSNLPGVAFVDVAAVGLVPDHATSL